MHPFDPHQYLKKPATAALRLALCLYDCLRLFFLLNLLSNFIAAAGPAGMFQTVLESAAFPFMAYAAPNALFPLMSFFLLIRFAESRAFVPLYITGKLISAAALAAWTAAAGLRQGSVSLLMLWSSFWGAADIATAAGAALIQAAFRKGETVLPARLAEDEVLRVQTNSGGSGNHEGEA